VTTWQQPRSQKICGPESLLALKTELLKGKWVRTPSEDGVSTTPAHVYEIRPRNDHRGFDLISDVLPFGRLWHAEPNSVGNAIAYAMHYSRSHAAVIRVYDDGGNVIETHEHKGDFKEA